MGMLVDWKRFPCHVLQCFRGCLTDKATSSNWFSACILISKPVGMWVLEALMKPGLKGLDVAEGLFAPSGSTIHGEVVMITFRRKNEDHFTEGEGLEEFDEGIVPGTHLPIMAWVAEHPRTMWQ